MFVIHQDNFTSDQKSLMALFHELCFFYACSNEFWQVAVFSGLPVEQSESLFLLTHEERNVQLCSHHP